MFWILVIATFVVIAGAVTYFGWFYESANSERPSNSLVDPSTAKISSSSASSKSGSGDAISSAAVSALSSKIDSKETIKQIITLRKQSSSKETVKIAQSVSILDEKLRKLNNPSVLSAWQETASCVRDGCAEVIYIKLINAVAIADPNKNNKIVNSITETYFWWDGKNNIELFKSLANTEKLVRELNQPSINIIWDDIIQCDGKCASFSDKTITLIERIVG